MRFGRSFTRQRRFGSMKMQTFENGFQCASFLKRSPCKQQTHESVETMTSCTCVLLAQSIGFHRHLMSWQQNTAFLGVFANLCE